MDLDSFFAAMRGSNPFSSTRVNSPDETVITVEAIHRQEFQRLCDGCELARQQSRAIGVLLQGAAGVGKSHLLSRLGAWATREHKAIYLYLHNVMASPEAMPRHFLRSLVSQLASARESFKDSSLYGLIHALMKSLRKSGTISGKRVFVSAARQAFLARAATFGLREDRINSAVFEVLFQFYADVNMNPQIHGPVATRVTSIVDWLSGDGITDEAAESIGIPPVCRQRDEDGLVKLQDDHHVEQILLILAALAQASNRILLACLDQFDNLSPEQVRSFSRFVHALLDHAKSLVLITAGVSESILKFRETQVISEAQWDRIAELEISLHMIARSQAEDLIRARLEPVQSQARYVPALARLLDMHPIFPIGAKEFEQRFGEAIELRPRSVVRWADEIWRAEQEQLRRIGDAAWLETWSETPVVPLEPNGTMDEVIDAAVFRALNEIIAERRNDPGSLPLDADNLATVVERLLRHCRTCDENLVADVSRMKDDRPCHLVIRKGSSPGTIGQTTAITFVTSRDGRSARHPLDRLAEYCDANCRVLITDEETAPLPMTATIAETYQRLTAGSPIPFRHIKLDYQQRVELEAVRCAIDDAQNITIAFPRGTDRGLTPAEVAQSLHRQGRLLLHPLLAELLSNEPPLHEPVPASPTANSPPAAVSRGAIETVIHGNLGWKISITSNDVVREVMELLPSPQPCFEDVHAAVVNVARVGEEKGALIVKEHLNGLLLLKP